MIKESERQKQTRQHLKDVIEKVCSSNKEAANVLKSFNRKQQGRPRIEAEQPELLSTIVKLVQKSTAADKRRRIECLSGVTTLNDIHKELTELDFPLSRSALYLRLLPRRGNTREGKCHVNTVPVKILRPENSLRKKNEDRVFAKSFIDDIFDLCKRFGHDSFIYVK